MDVIGTNVIASAVDANKAYEELIDADANEADVSIVNCIDEVNA